jgi:hypothetical protein
MCLLGILGDDGKTDHAIAVAGGWIFDSNFERGLSLTKNSLDLCCSSESSECAYVAVTRGWLVTRNIPKKTK